jgi:nucleoside-diphosphate-sugar epimerase
MRIFIAGATGVVGRHLVPKLISAGHSVIGLTRTTAKTEALVELGAEAVVADALDAWAVERAVASSRPDVVLNELTDIGAAADYRHFDRAFARTNELRTRGTDHLLAAARKAGVRRFIAQSFCGWPFAREGERVKSEADELDPDPPHELHRSLAALRYLEQCVSSSPDVEGIVLRYGYFYGEATGMLSLAMQEEIRQRRMPLIGAEMAGGHSCMSRTPRLQPCWRSSAARPGMSTTSSMTSRRPRVIGCLRSHKCSAPRLLSMCRRSSPVSSPASIS